MPCISNFSGYERKTLDERSRYKKCCFYSSLFKQRKQSLDGIMIPSRELFPTATVPITIALIPVFNVESKEVRNHPAHLKSAKESR